MQPGANARSINTGLRAGYAACGSPKEDQVASIATWAIIGRILGADGIEIGSAVRRHQADKPEADARKQESSNHREGCAGRADEPARESFKHFRPTSPRSALSIEIFE